MPFRFYAHLSWTTWARLPLIDEAVANFLGPFLLAEAKRQGARVMEVGIVRDHVHLLLELPPVYDAPRLVQGLKGAGARIANRDGHSGRGSLRWETGYDFRSVGIRQLPGVRAQSGAEARPTETVQTAEPFRARVVAEPALQRTDKQPNTQRIDPKW